MCELNDDANDLKSFEFFNANEWKGAKLRINC